jgi:hypothetical protein
MKNLIVALLITILAYAPLATVSAQQLTTEEMFNQLTASLLAIGQAITNSTTLTDAESLALMTQLITISNSIVTLREDYRMRGLVSAPTPSTEVGKMSAEDANLERIVVAYDAETEAINVTMRYSTTTIERNYIFTALPASASYGEKLSRVITDMETQLSNSTGVFIKDIKDVMFVTSWNPIRDTSIIGQNSNLARNLADNFAKFSIVNRVELRPGNGRGELEFYTDQKESLRLTLERNVDENGTFLGTYTYVIQFFFPSLINSIMMGAGTIDGQTVEVAQYEQTDRDVKEDEVLDFVIGLFTDVPFTTAISGFDKKLVRFLTQNNTYYSSNQSSVTNRDLLDCYRASDKKIVTQFVDFLAGGIDVQFENVEDMMNYVAPIHVEELNFGGECVQAARFF